MSAPAEVVKRINSRNSNAADSTSDKVDEASAPPVSLLSLYRFLGRSERILAVVGLALAMVAGAMQPLMTIVFGSLTSAFTQYGSVQMQLSSSVTPELEAALQSAESNVRRQARDAALYLLGIGIGMMIATYIYMLIFNYLAEVNSKRLRESYLRSVLRQEIAYFDTVGAGEVATRIQTDCHLVQDGTGE